MSASPFDILGVSPASPESEIRLAWRKKASSLHPDVGGSHDAMILLNEALAQALSLGRLGHTENSPESDQKKSTTSRSYFTRDISSFTIDALPVDAWHLLLMGATHCGPIVDEEEPYVLDFMLSDTSIPELRSSMCRCEIVPEAGASTVHVTIFSETGKSVGVEMIRDVLVSTINDLSNNLDT